MIGSKKLYVLGLVVMSACGTDYTGSSNRKPATVTTTTTNQNCVTVDGKDCGPVVSTTTVTGVGGLPDSYTFLDTPDANLCVDAFIRQGIELPATTVARSFDSFNSRNNGIAWQDMGASAVPVLNILRLSSRFSNVTFQMLNPVGFYCIVKNGASFSNVTIQRRCSAQLAEIEPITHTTVNEPVHGCGWFHWPWEQGDNMAGTTSSYNSIITEAPCIP